MLYINLKHPDEKYKETEQDRKGELASKPLNINKIENI